ncbi:glycine zipper 2TM domain-containing protein [Sphingomonas sp. CBMAI 2297]|uniref:glycine zipper 2TM domain-containing protein n=1 Tax=Sphingomonas sp. CBMAI 2297 TaxID=2991720 RepID=UPI00245676B4|nr:glycine zipper 2TM domain-containing protein [Sphingomonas sp. CBMAI 2297]MDH4745980.1 glycine zipper 2TM domain-containing protein [Sphingomonas sp. CBMAI 2297]
MRKLILALGAIAVAVPSAGLVPIAANAAPVAKAGADGNWSQDRGYRKRYAYREWRGRDGRSYCRKPDGTTGLVVGGVAGALVGRTIDTRGDRTVGTLLGAAAGAVAGREIERSGKRRCR